MKTQPASARPYRLRSHLLGLFLVLFSLNGFSQAPQKTETKAAITTLQKVVDGIKEKNVSIKNAEHLNIMVNDKLVENLQGFILDPKNIAMVEVLVLEPKAGSSQRVDPSIIINTKIINTKH